MQETTMQRRHWIRAASAAALAMSLAAPALAQPKDKVILLLNWYVYSEHAPFFLGKERATTTPRASTSRSRKGAARGRRCRRSPRARRPSATSTSAP